MDQFIMNMYSKWTKPTVQIDLQWENFFHAIGEEKERGGLLVSNNCTNQSEEEQRSGPML